MSIEHINHKVSYDNRGYLIPLELKDIPFPVKRVFTVLINSAHKDRGGHAHKECQQYFVCIAGNINILFFKNGEKIFNDFLSPGQAILIEPGIHAIYNGSRESMAMVLCSHEYDPDDYIYV